MPIFSHESYGLLWILTVIWVHCICRYLNYAGAGFFIGHEVTHGFDNTGRQHSSGCRYILWALIHPWIDSTIQVGIPWLKWVFSEKRIPQWHCGNQLWVQMKKKMNVIQIGLGDGPCWLVLLRIFRFKIYIFRVNIFFSFALTSFRTFFSGILAISGLGSRR